MPSVEDDGFLLVDSDDLLVDLNEEEGPSPVAADPPKPPAFWARCAAPHSTLAPAVPNRADF